MKKRIALMLAALCLMLSGCSWLDGSYVSVTPHQEQTSGGQSGAVSAANYLQLRTVLQDMVDSGTENAVINVAEYDQEQVAKGMQTAVNYLSSLYPLGAYAVDRIDYDIGVSGGKPAVSVSISYIHGRSEIRKIKTVPDMTEAEKVIAEALDACNESVVLLVRHYEREDLVQMVEDFAEQNPDIVMETPQVAEGLYPDAGTSRIVELKFTYQTSRDSLRQMQDQVEPLFAAAMQYVSGDGSDSQKYNQLYGFLMERFDYTIETSITPAYSLLRHGVGDSKAFAMVYAAMCRQAGLECRIVSGTRNGEAWYWNLICEDGIFFYVDLLQSSASGQLQRLSDDQMHGYVWDYSAYPAADAAQNENLPE